jgi:L-ascorbate oxidase
MIFLVFLTICLSLVSALEAHVHDASFIPDAVLRISAETVSVGGIQRHSVLINGSIPGPELRFPEGKVIWIRAYNDMADQNVTMVSA